MALILYQSELRRFAEEADGEKKQFIKDGLFEIFAFFQHRIDHLWFGVILLRFQVHEIPNRIGLQMMIVIVAALLLFFVPDLQTKVSGFQDILLFLDIDVVFELQYLHD